MIPRPAHPRTAPLLLLALLAAAPATAGTWEAIERLPGQTPVAVMVGDNQRLYFRVTPERPLTVPIEGPARLRLTSRVDFSSAKVSLVAYTLRVVEGDRVLERQQTESAPSSVVHGAEGKGDVGKSRRMTVDVPAGRHELKIEAGGVPAVLVRLHQAAPRRGSEATVSLTPVDAMRSVLVAEGEKTIPYYSTTPGKPVRLRVVGPTTLELIARLDFDASMRGTQGYRIAISEGGRRVREAAFKTTKATTAVFTNLKDRVPSKFDRLTLPIGGGTHELLVELLAPAGGTAEIHARIPEPSVGNEE